MIRSLTPEARGMVEPKKIIVALIEGRKIPFEERRIIKEKNMQSNDPIQGIEC
jgi:hypothetical protein